MLGLDKAIGGGGKLFTYLCIFGLLQILRIQRGDLRAFELELLIHVNQYSFCEQLICRWMKFVASSP